MSVVVNKHRQIMKGRVFTITQENVTLPNGFNTDFEIIRHPGASAIIPITHSDEILMLKQYRHAVGDYLWEIPAGTLNQNEAPLTCAQRELEEETGYSAATWTLLSGIVPVPGYSDERIYIYLATDLSFSRQNLDQDEVLEVHPIGISKVLSMIAAGEIKDSKTIAGILLAAVQPESRIVIGDHSING